jgi:imidazolonepropionase-like amidohydrolase
LRGFLVGLLVLTCLSTPVGAAAAEGGGATVVFVGVTVVDVERGELVPGRAVVTVGPKITEVIAAEGYQPPPGATVVDGAGKFLIPGLWDMHVHHPFPWEGFLDLALANGVTGVRDLNGEQFFYA